MYNINNLTELKTDAANAAHMWVDNKVNELISKHPKLSSIKDNIANAGHNLIYKYENDIQTMIDKFSIFLANKNGEISSDDLINAFGNIFDNMDTHTFDLGVTNITVGQGNLTIDVPDNMMMRLMFGNIGKVKFNTKDLLELKTLMKK